MRLRLTRTIPLCLILAMGCVSETPVTTPSPIPTRGAVVKKSPSPSVSPSTETSSAPSVSPSTSTSASPSSSPSASPSASTSPSASPSASTSPSPSPSASPSPADTDISYPDPGTELYTVTLMAGGTAGGAPVDNVAEAAVIGKSEDGTGLAINGAVTSLVYFTDGAFDMVRSLASDTKTVSAVAFGQGEAGWNNPSGLVYDATRKVLYISDAQNGRIKRFFLTGNTVGQEPGTHDVIAGGPTPDTTYRDGPGLNGTAETKALFQRPIGLALDGNTLYVSDRDHNTIRAIDVSQENFPVTFVAGGKGPSGAPANLTTPETRAAARFNSPAGLAVATLSGKKTLLVADTNNHCIRAIDLSVADGQVSVYVGSTTSGNKDGAAADARFNLPIAIAADGEGKVYLGEKGNPRLRRIDATKKVQTLAGGLSVGGVVGNGANARFGSITGLTLDVDVSGKMKSVYVYDPGTASVGPRLLKVAL